MNNLLVYYIYAYSFCTLLYLYYRINKRVCRQHQFASDKQIIYLNKRHLLGNLIMALAIMASAFQKGSDMQFLLFNWNVSYTWLTYTLFFIAFTISVYSGRIDSATSSNNVDWQEKIFYLVLRIFFLVVYEFFFRIIMLQAFFFLPIAFAVIINIFLYSLAHVFNGKKQVIGSVPFGLALCLLTIIHQSVWPAIILHLLLSLPYEIINLYSKKLIIKTSTT